MKQIIAILCFLTFFSAGTAQAYCLATGTYTNYEYIQSIDINDDIRDSGNNAGYLNDSDEIALEVGENSLSLTPGFSYGSYNERWAIWIDLDHDGLYETAERLYSGISSSPIYTSITIPATALTGTTGMRVAMRYGATPAACGSFTWGEVEDYIVNISSGSYPHHLTLSYDFTATRSGEIGDDLTWVVEKDGAIVLQRNAAGELSYRYFYNVPGSHYRIWLSAYINGGSQQVSNIVEYSPGITDMYELTLGNDYSFERSGAIGDPVQWVIEKDGEIVLERNASDELSYTFFSNTADSKFRVWLKQFIDGEYKIVSNTVEYQPGAFDDFQTLTLGDNFEISRTGELYGGYVWVIEKDGVVVLQRSADGEMSYTYYNNVIGSSYRIWLTKFHNGEYVVASNVVLYNPGTTYAYSLNLGTGYQLSRSGSLGDPVQWVIEKNGSIVLQRNAANELTYTYYANTPGSTIRVWLQQFIGGYYQQVSNIVTYNP